MQSRGLTALPLWARLLILAFVAGLLVAFVAMVAVLRGGGDALREELRSLTGNDLDVLVLPLEEMGPEFADFEAVDAGVSDNWSAAEESLDPDDTADGLEEQGRITGYELTYADPFSYSIDSGEGILYVSTSVELFQDAESASNTMAQRVERLEEMKNSGLALDVEMGEVSTFAVDGLGNEAVRIRSDLFYTSAFVLHQTLVSFTMDRLVAVAMIGSLGDEDFDGPVEEVARSLERRISGVLVGEIEATPVTVVEPAPEELPEEQPLGPGHTLGLRCGYASRFLRERYDLPPDKGCVVLRVSSPGAAERAGFQIGDKIIGLDGRPITSGRQFTFLFEELPGIQQSGEFVVQRGDEELRLDVELADRAELPEEDPYFFYLRAKDDTELLNYEQVIADYTKAIELEPGFDLAYLYRGITYMEEDVEAAQADVLRALELDPELTEAHRALAQMAQWEDNPEEALLFIEESLHLNECGHPLEEWDIDCAEDVVFRTSFLFQRLEEGDDLLIEQEVDRVENVVFFEPSVAYSRFRLAYLRGADDLARDLGEVFVSTPINRLFADLQSEQSRVRNMLGAGSEIHTYSMWPWPTGRLVEVQFHELQLESPEGLRKTSDGKLVKTLLLFELPKPDRFREDAVAWELFHGSYRLASYSTPSAWGEDWLVEFGLMIEPPPGLYELRVYVNGEPFGVTQMEFP